MWDFPTVVYNPSKTHRPKKSQKKLTMWDFPSGAVSNPKKKKATKKEKAISNLKKGRVTPFMLEEMEWTPSQYFLYLTHPESQRSYARTSKLRDLTGKRNPRKFLFEDVRDMIQDNMDEGLDFDSSWQIACETYEDAPSVKGDVQKHFREIGYITNPLRKNGKATLPTVTVEGASGHYQIVITETKGMFRGRGKSKRQLQLQRFVQHRVYKNKKEATQMAQFARKQIEMYHRIYGVYPDLKLLTATGKL